MQKPSALEYTGSFLQNAWDRLSWVRENQAMDNWTEHFKMLCIALLGVILLGPLRG